MALIELTRKRRQAKFTRKRRRKRKKNGRRFFGRGKKSEKARPNRKLLERSRRRSLLQPQLRKGFEVCEEERSQQNRFEPRARRGKRKTAE